MRMLKIKGRMQAKLLYPFLVVIGCSVLQVLSYTAFATTDLSITIATGNPYGVYHPTGGAICRFINRSRLDHSITCTPKPTHGTLENLTALKSGEAEFALIQSDWQYYAYHGAKYLLKESPMKNLRSVFSLNAEAFVILTKEDAHIHSFNDLKHKVIDMGTSQSGTQGTIKKLLKVKRWKPKHITIIEHKNQSLEEQIDALCQDQVNALIIATGHPNHTIKYFSPTCPIKFLGFEVRDIKLLTKEHPFYDLLEIPAHTYPNQPDPIHTFGVTTTLVTTSNVSNMLVYEVVKAVFDNYDNFKTLHSAFKDFEPLEQITKNSTAPLHEGAKRYYLEAGLIHE